MRVLVVGLGGIGQRHVRNLRQILGSDVDIAAVDVRRVIPVVTEDLQLEAGSTLEGKYGVRFVRDLDSALGAQPDAVLICNPTSRHIPVALAAAKAGAHLFIEKPLSHNWDGIDELVDLVQQRRLVSLIGYQLRFHPVLQRLHQLLQQGAIGQILAVRAEVGEYLPGWHKYEDYRQSYAARRELGGGVVLSQIHEFDYLYWFFGLPQRIFALGGHLSRLEIDVEDTADILLQCSQQGRPVPISLHQDYLQQPPSRGCQVVGDRGKIVVDLRAPSINVYDDQGRLAENKTFTEFVRNQLFMDEMQHFLGCIRDEVKPSVPVRDGAQSLRMALAAKESIATGKIIDMENWLP